MKGDVVMYNDCIICNVLSEPIKGCDKHILDTDNFFVVAGKGQLCKGYSIICTKKHLLNLTELNDFEKEELKAIKNSITSVTNELFGYSPIYFEHGDVEDSLNGGCIKHAHIHVIPLKLMHIPSHLIDNGGRIFDNEDEAQVFMRENRPYFYIENSAKEICVLNSNYFQHQYGRMLLVKELNLEIDWDWRNYSYGKSKIIDEQNMMMTISMFTDKLRRL